MGDWSWAMGWGWPHAHGEDQVDFDATMLTTELREGMNIGKF